MTKLKALVVTLIVGTASAAVADPIVSSRDYRRPHVYQQPYRREPVRLTLTGSYTSEFGSVRLWQHGDRLTGTFTAGGGGRIEGRIVGNEIRFRWRNTSERGHGVWYMANPNRIEGTWGTGRSNHDGGAWNLKRL